MTELTRKDSHKSPHIIRKKQKKTRTPAINLHPYIIIPTQRLLVIRKVPTFAALNLAYSEQLGRTVMHLYPTVMYLIQPEK